MTTQILLNEWLETYQKEHIKARTYSRYQGLISMHILPALGATNISELGRREIQEFLTQQKKDGNIRNGEKLSATSANMMLSVLNLAFEYACDMEYIEENRAVIKYDLPLNEIIYDFFDALKSRSRGYASFDYELKGYVRSELVKLDILINREMMDALSFIVFKDNAYERGRRMCERLKEEIPRHLFEIPIQAAVGSKIIARETVKAMRKLMMFVAAVALVAGCSEDLTSDVMVGPNGSENVSGVAEGISLEVSVEDVTRVTITGDKVNHEGNECRDMSLEDEPTVGLTFHDFRQLHGVGQYDDSQKAQSHGKFITNHLRTTSHGTDKRVFIVRTPAC